MDDMKHGLGALHQQNQQKPEPFITSKNTHQTPERYLKTEQTENKQHQNQKKG